ncbi:MAG: DMT family transporter [Gemmataceae bacterium]
MSSQLLDRPNVSRRILTPPSHAYLLMLGSSLAFATMTTCGHALHDRCDWRITAVFRASLAFLFTLIVARSSRVKLVFWKPRTLWMRSLVGSVSMLFTFYAMKELPVGTLLTLTNTFPIWVTLLAWPVLGERPSAAFAVALASGVVGVYLIEHPTDGSINPATLAALFASFCTAIVMLGLHRLRRIESLAIVVHFSGVATVVCFGYAAYRSYVGDAIDLTALTRPDTIALLAGVGVFATIGQIAMTRAFGIGSPQKLAVVGLAQVVFALGFDFAIWGHRLDAASAFGTLLILAPVAWLLGRRRS